MTAVRVTEIVIYPIKSTAGISVDARAVQAQGLDMDRRWMVVDGDGEFLSGRELPMLTQIRCRLEGDDVWVSAPGMDDIHIPPPGDSAPAQPVRVWDDACRAVAAGDAVDAWFARALGTRCHLVYMRDTGQRPVDFTYGQAEDRVSFADGFPLLLISQASLEDLNGRLEEAVSMRRFRPNLVVSGCGPYAEDGWRQVRIGETSFDVVKKCARCVFTTIDPDSGEKHPRLEPLRTLGSYRRGPGTGVFFGQNLIPRSVGTIRVGDVLAVDDASMTQGHDSGKRGQP
jgi:uncharacterized protein